MVKLHHDASSQDCRSIMEKHFASVEDWMVLWDDRHKWHLNNFVVSLIVGCQNFFGIGAREVSKKRF